MSLQCRKAENPRRRIGALGVGLVGLLVCAACAPTSNAPARAESGIVAFGPHLTETVFALGQGDRVVGRTRYCDYPPEALRLPVVGDYLSPDFEKLTVLRPSLLIVPGADAKLSTFAKLKGIPALNVDMDTLASIDAGIATIGAALGCGDRADSLRAQLRDRLDGVRRATAGKPRPRVLILTARGNHDLTGLYTVGPTSFLAELVDVAGGANLFAESPQRYFEASKETIVMRAPEVIFEFHAGETLAEKERNAFADDWKRLPSLPAVRDGRVHIITESYAMRPGPRIAEVAELFARLLHPDAAQIGQ
ncbi:MAG TPA: ABC transporter substrate-binding protein [Candidatus Hydrogenedentes bacterium]|nr:ABC transporter substrate-binding protein [Candidatus Hydrogenedentota bacterium]HOS01831.1 ABC transporter substrate-binding protein [Candidatus Hydrogenedentota bacterium]